jgi:hypothetical protein
MCSVSQQWCSATHLKFVKCGHMKMVYRDEEIPEEQPDRIAASEPLSLKVYGNWNSTLGALIGPTIRCGTLSVMHMDIRWGNDLLAKQLSHLGSVRTLTDVQIDSPGYRPCPKITSQGMHYLAALSGALRLKRLRLGLPENPIGDGVCALRRFHAHPSLTEMNLWFYRCEIGDNGVLGLSEMKTMPSLTHLHIILSGNRGITSQSVRYLSQLSLCPSLAQLTLFLDDPLRTDAEAIMKITAPKSLLWRVS